MSRNYADFNNITTISGTDFLVGYRIPSASGELRARVSDILAAGSASTRVLGICLNDGGSTLSTGIRGYSIAPFAGNIVGWNVTTNTTGNLSLDLYKGSANTVAATSVVGNGVFPILSGQISTTSSSITGWTTGISQYDNLAWVVTSASGISYAMFNVMVKTV